MDLNTGTKDYISNNNHDSYDNCNISNIDNNDSCDLQIYHDDDD
jgi:hypothetical protein